MVTTTITRNGPRILIEIDNPGSPLVRIDYDRKNATDLVTALNSVLLLMEDEPWVHEYEKPSSPPMEQL